MNSRFLNAIILVSCLLTATAQLAWSLSPQILIPTGGDTRRPVVLRGQSATLLPDGRWLLLGGQNRGVTSSAATIQDPRSGSTLAIKRGLGSPRAWHSATLLPNGKVLVFGGVDGKGQPVKIGEIFDPESQNFQVITTGLAPRAHHSATLLTDGRVLVAGGLSDKQTAAQSVELWDPRANAVVVLPSILNSERRDHFANILPDGTVLLWGGTDSHGNPIAYGEVYDPDRQAFSSTTFASPSAPDWNLPFLEDSLPADGAQDVAPDAVIAVRFSKSLRMTSVSPESLELSGPAGLVPAKIVPTESGMLAFVTPTSPMQPGATYLLRLQGAVDGQGLRLISKTISFKVAGQDESANSTSSSVGTGRQVPAEMLPPLKALPGTTALSGQVLRLDHTPLSDVTLQIGKLKTKSDSTGRFLLLLPGLKPGHQVLIIDGRTVNRGAVTYGLFEAGVDINGGTTNVLGYKIWMTALDMAHAVSIPSPTREETIVSTPLLPGLELHIPPRTAIYDYDGKIATKISITPVPINQPPFPLPRGVEVPIYFTIQPGGAYLKVEGTGAKGARLYYPNSRKLLPDTRFAFWNYDPDEKGWYVYGFGTVSPDRYQVVPDPEVAIYEFTGAMVGFPSGTPSTGPHGGPPRPPCKRGKRGRGCPKGDPVDPGTGLFVYESVDVSLPDILPIKLTRTYRQNDPVSRDFGVGTAHSYQIYIVGDYLPYTYLDLVMPDGGRVHYPRISPGTGYTDAVYRNTSSPNEFYGSTINWNGHGWDLRFKDGLVWTFPDSYLATAPNKSAVLSIRDRFGNTININRDSSTGNIKQITSPSGRWLQFTYDGSNRITQITDNIGRTLTYGYDTNSRLITATDQNGGVTTYGYDSTHLDRMTTITDARHIQYLQNAYDASGRVSSQTLANGGTYLFSYTTDSNGNITQTDVTDPNGNVDRSSFGTPELFQSGFKTGGYETSETFALGTPQQQIFTYDRGTLANNPGSFLLGVTDPLGRLTSYAFDASGNVSSVTRLAGTTNAATTSFTYESNFNRITSITDPLGRSTSFTYNDPSNTVTLTNPAGNRTVTTYNAAGQVASISDPLTNQWTFGYSGGDLSTSSDPLHNALTFVHDGAGRVTSVVDPIGNTTRYSYDALDKVTQIVDSLGNATQFAYDANENLISVTDPLHTTTPTGYSYNNMDLLQMRTDPLLNNESYQYDSNGNLTCYTDRRGNIDVYQYDGIDRRKLAGFGATSCSGGSYTTSITYSYDGGNRLLTVVDSISGQITRGYDGLDNVTSESSTISGTGHTVAYGFDTLGRRTSMTLDSQQPVTYSYDPLNHPTQISQGTSSVSFGYDAVGHRTSLTLPNSVTAQYAYDAAGHVTGITYQLGGTTLGSLSYSYNADGKITQKGGSFAATNLPNAFSSASYNANNQLTVRGATSYTFDLNSNLKTDGVNTYNWDERNQLNSITGGTTASFAYDALQRRISKSVGGLSTSLLYDQNQVIEELAGGAPVANLLTGLAVDEVYSRTDAAGARYLLADLSGSTAALTDSTGAVQTQYTYDPFGNTTSTGAISANPIQYAGRENDSTGLYFLRARYLSPGLGRFISEDPQGFGGGVNVYAYAGNDPIDFTDPFGLRRRKPPLPPCQPGDVFIQWCDPTPPPGTPPGNPPPGNPPPGNPPGCQGQPCVPGPPPPIPPPPQPPPPLPPPICLYTKLGGYWLVGLGSGMTGTFLGAPEGVPLAGIGFGMAFACDVLDIP